MSDTLRRTTTELRDCYRSLDGPIDLPRPNPSRFFPLVTECKLDSGELLRFRYVRPLGTFDWAERVAECITFLIGADTVRQFVVKFVETYDVKVYRLLTRHGFAPKLSCWGLVWLDEATRKGYLSRWMVVMEYTRGTTSANKYVSWPSAAVRRPMRNAFKMLHEKRMVQEDIREPNIMVPTRLRAQTAQMGRKCVRSTRSWMNQAGRSAR